MKLISAIILCYLGVTVLVLSEVSAQPSKAEKSKADMELLERFTRFLSKLMENDHDDKKDIKETTLNVNSLPTSTKPAEIKANVEAKVAHDNKASPAISPKAELTKLDGSKTTSEAKTVATDTAKSAKDSFLKLKPLVIFTDTEGKHYQLVGVGTRSPQGGCSGSCLNVDPDSKDVLVYSKPNSGDYLVLKDPNGSELYTEGVQLCNDYTKASRFSRGPANLSLLVPKKATAENQLVAKWEDEPKVSEAKTSGLESFDEFSSNAADVETFFSGPGLKLTPEKKAKLSPSEVMSALDQADVNRKKRQKETDESETAEADADYNPDSESDASADQSNLEDTLAANSRTANEVKLLEGLHKDKKRLEEASSSGVAQVDVDKCKKGCESIKKEGLKDKAEEQKQKNKRSFEEEALPFILDMMNDDPESSTEAKENLILSKNNNVTHRSDTDENPEEEINMNQPNTAPQVENEVVLHKQPDKKNQNIDEKKIDSGEKEKIIEKSNSENDKLGNDGEMKHLDKDNENSSGGMDKLASDVSISEKDKPVGEKDNTEKAKLAVPVDELYFPFIETTTLPVLNDILNPVVHLKNYPPPLEYLNHGPVIQELPEVKSPSNHNTDFGGFNGNLANSEHDMATPPPVYNEADVEIDYDGKPASNKVGTQFAEALSFKVQNDLKMRDILNGGIKFNPPMMVLKPPSQHDELYTSTLQLLLKTLMTNVEQLAENEIERRTCLQLDNQLDDFLSVMVDVPLRSHIPDELRPNVRPVISYSNLMLRKNQLQDLLKEYGQLSSKSQVEATGVKSFIETELDNVEKLLMGSKKEKDRTKRYFHNGLPKSKRYHARPT